MSIRSSAPSLPHRLTNTDTDVYKNDAAKKLVAAVVSKRKLWEEMNHFSFRARFAWCRAKVSHARHEKENK